MILFPALLLLASTIIVRAQTSAQRAQPETRFDYGKQAFELKKYDTAERFLKDSIKHKETLSPDQWAAAYQMLAEIYWRKGKQSDAVKYAKEALKHTDDSEGHRLLALIYFRTGSSAEAQSEVGLAIQLDTSNSAAYELRGDIEIASNQFKEAFESYETALRYAPPNSERASDLKTNVDDLEDYLSVPHDHKGENYKSPIPLNRPVPEYPSAARDAKEHGLVKLLVEVKPDGTVGKVLILSGGQDGFGDSAIAAARRMRFAPATVDGKATAAWIRLEMEFIAS